MRSTKIRILLFALIAVCIAHLMSLKYSNTGMDDAILGEQVYWLHSNGIVKSKLFSGMDKGWEIRQYHYHKLFIFLGSVWISITGWSLLSLKVFMLLIVSLSGILFYKMIKVHFDTDDLTYPILGVLFLLINTSIFFYGHLFRPELMVMAFGILSYYYLNKYQKEENNSTLLLAALFSGMAVITHLNGVVFIFAGGMALLAIKKYKSFFVFGLAACLTSMFYFADIHSLEELNQLKNQFFSDPNLVESGSKLFSPILKILDEHKRIFRSPREITLFGLFFSMLILNFKFYRSKHTLLLWYSIASIIGLAAVAHGITTKYSIIYYPIIVLLILLGVQNLIRNGKKSAQWFTYGVVATYFVVHVIYNIDILTHHDNPMERNEMVTEYLEKGDHVLATETFVFDNLEDYDIISFLGFRYKLFNYVGLEESDISRDDIFDFAQRWDRNVIFIDKKLEDKRISRIIDFKTLDQGKSYSDFNVLLNNSEVLLMKKD